MHQPLVSICIPTFNGMAFLESALASALSQSYHNIEILICDDGSTDGTVDFIAAQTDSRIRIIQNTEHNGMVSNWNYCLLEARGEWIKLLFQDDLMEKNCIQEILEAGNRFNTEVVICSRNFIIEKNAERFKQEFFRDKVIKPEHLFGQNETYITPQDLASKVKHQLINNILGEPSCYFFKKSVLQETGLFKTNMIQYVDYEFILRLGLKYGFAFVPTPLIIFRVHGKAQSSINADSEKPSSLKAIKATTGDAMILIQEYLTNERFRLIREAVGDKLLKWYLRHIYYSGCKHNGITAVNKALQEIMVSYRDHIKKYSFLKYVYYRWKVNNWKRLVN